MKTLMAVAGIISVKRLGQISGALCCAGAELYSSPDERARVPEQVFAAQRLRHEDNVVREGYAQLSFLGAVRG